MKKRAKKLDLERVTIIAAPNTGHSKADFTQFNRIIGERIRHAREKVLGINRQVDFANRLGVSRGAVGNWELGRGVKRANLQRIAAEFKISVDWLVSGVGRPEASKPSIETRASQALPFAEAEAFLDDIEALLERRVARLAKEKQRETP